MKYIIIVCILCAFISLYQAKIKGYFGEKAVAMVLSRLPKEEYKVIHDIMLRTEYGTTQIDHIIVSVYGIFVIETKNYKGWITGGENSEKWTKNMYGKKYSFRNPLKQNYAHVKALEKVLDIPFEQFIPIVAFSSNGTIKVHTSKPVVYINRLPKVIKNYKERCFTYEQVCSFQQKLMAENIVEKKQRKEHVQQIHKRIAQDESKVKSGECPKCGGRLVKRKGKYGEFFGCENYPKCKYKQSI